MPKLSANVMRNLPNQITMGRLLAVPLLLLIYPFNAEITNVACAFIFLIASLTDILDGYLARKYNLSTRLGALLDPLADKMLTGACLVLLASTKALYAWVCGALICRDIAVSGMRMIALQQNGQDIKVSSFGKIKTILQDTGIFCLLMGHDYLNLPFRLVGMTAVWLSLIVSYYSGYMYWEEFLKLSKDEPKPNALSSVDANVD